jgi:hypothetical protein
VGALLAAQRDASWFSSGRGGNGGVYHVMTPDGLPLCGQRTLLIDDRAVPAGDVEPMLRCRRNGCRQAYDQLGAVESA